MIHIKKISLFLSIVTIFVVAFVISPKKVFAKEVDSFSYKNVYDALPKKFQTSDYVFENDGITYIKFASNKGNIYRTSVKKSSGKKDYLYCVNYNKHIIFNKTYSAQNNLFNNSLRSRIGLALYHGPSQWGELADSAFSTGNSVMDYYMTQCVIHALIFKYGENKTDFGINFSNYEFDSKASTLQKKTKLFYDFCCKTPITLTNGHFQPVKFSFKKPKSNQLFMNGDVLISDKIECLTDPDNASVDGFTRKVKSEMSNESIFHIQSESNSYNSSFQIVSKVTDLDSMNPGKYSFSMEENVNFKPYIAGFWNCTDKDFANKGQEVGGLIENAKSVSDKIMFDFLIGEVTLSKTDSLSGEIIPDATFELLQFDDTQNTYVPYKHLAYNESSRMYESGNIYISSNNHEAKFKIVESSSGAYHVNDWSGTIFQLTDNQVTFHYDVENMPVRGRLDIHKVGEEVTFEDESFIYDKTINLKNIIFSVYAETDIYEKGNLLYKANEKVADIKTDEAGSGALDNLPLGKYYLNETSTLKQCILDGETYHFQISRDEKGEFSKITYELKNKLKKCDINLFKYYYENADAEQKKKIPLSGAKFGIYAAEDIYNLSGNCIVKKDTLLKEAVTNQDGKVVFKDLYLADYYLKELEAPEGFVIHESIIPVSQNTFELLNSKQNYTSDIECMNNKQTFQLEILKNGDSFQRIDSKSSENGEFYTYILNEAPIENVEISLYNENNELIEKQSTDKNGIVRFSHLETGTYYYAENSAPKEYILDSEKHYVTIAADDRNKMGSSTSATETVLVESDDKGVMQEPVIKTSFSNKLFSTHLHITKLGEVAEIESDKLVFNTKTLEGITFGIYQNFDYLFPEGNTVPSNACLGYIITDRNGEGYFDGVLPAGQYYLRELKTSPGYLLDEEAHYFNVTAENKDCDVFLNNEKNTLTNYLAKASVQIYKTDADTKKPLKNVEFTLYNDQNKEIGKYKTNRKGYIVVENLPYGSYYFVETKCPKGYYSTNNKYYFNLESPDTITLNITNQPILKLGFNEHYKAYMLICIIIMAAIFIWSFYMKKGGEH